MLPDEPTIDDYIAYAEQNNPAIRAARERWHAALERVRQARSLPDPRLSFGEFVESVETRVGPQEWNATLSQTFPWFGTLGLRGDAARSGAAMAAQQVEALRLKIIYQLKHDYYEYYYLARAVGVSEENVQLVADLEEVARTAYAAGRVPQAAVIKAQVELEKLRDRLRTLSEQRIPVAAKINALLGREADAPLPWPQVLPDDDEILPAAELLNQLRTANPELRALAHAANRASRAEALARKARYPDLTLGVTYVSTGDAVMPNVAGSGKDPVMVMLSVNLPVWGGRNRAVIREARAQLESAIAERGDRENMLVAELEMALFKYNDAVRKITLYRDTLVPQAKQSLNVTQQAFTAGTVAFLDLIDAQRTLLEIQLMAERALVDRAQQRAALDMLTGRGLSNGAGNTAVGNQLGADGVEK